MALSKANPKLTGEVLRLRCVKGRTSPLPAAETFWEQPFPKHSVIGRTATKCLRPLH